MRHEMVFKAPPALEVPLEIKEKYPFIKQKISALVIGASTGRLMGGLIPDLIGGLNCLGNPTVYLWENEEGKLHFSQEPEVIFTTVSLNQIIENPLIINAQELYHLEKRPLVVTLVEIDEKEYQEVLKILEKLEEKEKPPLVILVVGDKKSGELKSLIGFERKGGRLEIKINDSRNTEEAARNLILRLMIFWSTSQARDNE